MKTRIKINWEGAKSPPEPPKVDTPPEVLEAIKSEPAPLLVDSVDCKFDGDDFRLVLEPEIKTVPEKKHAVLDENKESVKPAAKVTKPAAKTIGQLALLQSPPEGMEQKEWELKISAERLTQVHKQAMKSRFDIEVPFYTVPERACFKNFYGYTQDLAIAEDVVRYVVENWPGVKVRYKLPYEYPVAHAFAYAKFAKQIVVEVFRKRNVTTEDPKYVDDFKEDDNVRTQQYQSDW